MSIYKELLDKLDLRDIAEDFVGSNEHRLSVFAGPAEANFHWTGISLIFIFIAYDSAPLQFLVACDEI